MNALINTIQVTIATTDAAVKDLLVAQFADAGYDGFEEKENELIACIGEPFFKEDVVKRIALPFLLSYHISVVPDENWNAVWESNFTPVVVEDFCAVRADFHPAVNHVKHDIIITPKMSFGTGHHATTYMMLSEMRNLDFDNKRVADFGTGTGVLAILAEKLGSSYVLATDIDEWSLANAKENTERNHCSKITIQYADAFQPLQKFDIVLANINRNVIADNAASIAASLQGSSKLLVSGLLKEDEGTVISIFTAQGLEHFHTATTNNWVCMLFGTA